MNTLLRNVDALVITAATQAHADLLKAGVAAHIPTFCEKPVAVDLPGSIELARLEEQTQVPIQIGFQRRFDLGYQRARQAVRDAELGFIHTVRANTHDQSPPPAEYIPTSGGIFRDCNVHDFDIIRFVTGHQVVQVYAIGANKGADSFGAAGDVDTAAALLTLDDETLVTVSSTRYNGGGHDVRMEVMGSEGTIGVGYDDSLAVRSAEPDASYPAGPRKWSFMERFLPAYQRELSAFTDVVAGRATSPCSVADDALQAFRIAEACEISRAQRRPVQLSEIADG